MSTRSRTVSCPLVACLLAVSAACSQPAVTDSGVDGSRADAAGDAVGDTNSPNDASDATPDAGPPIAVACHLPPRGMNDPEYPRETVDTAMPMQAGRTIALDATGDLQAAIAMAQPGDTITLAAGAAYTGNFTLPEKTGTGWIVIRSADGAIPAEGTRVSPGDASHLARIVTPNTLPAINTAARAHHYRFIGIEFAPAAGQNVNDLIVFGSGSETDAAQLAHHLVLDRCWIHADPTVGGKRGVQLNSAHTAIIDSYVSGWRRVGQDTQAVLGWNGPGPFRIVNNRLEGAAENIMFGGADPAIANLVPSDIEICGNYIVKPTAWRVGDPSFEGMHWSVKNLFELKMARRVIVAGNVLENCWADAQVGFAVVIKSANQDGSAPWAATEDVTFAYNVVRHSAHGINVTYTDGNTTGGTSRVRFYSNLLTGIGEMPWGGDGRIYQMLNGAQNITFDHNTAIGVDSNNVLLFDGAADPGFVFTNNIDNETRYGVIGSGAGEGNSALTMFAPGATFTGNVLTGRTETSYPSGNFFPADEAAIGFASDGSYALTTSSPFHARATDGTDLGADIPAITAATAGVAR